MTRPARPADLGRLLPAALFAASFLASLYQLAHNPGVPIGRGFEAVAVAENLARGNGFSNPFAAAETGPTAVVPPVYPLLLAGIIRVFGDGVYFAAAATLLALLVQALHAALLPPVSKMLFDDFRPGAYAALIAVALPVFKLYPAREAIYVAAALMAFCLVTGPRIPDSRGLVWRGAGNGAAAGLLALLNPITLPVSIAWEAFRTWGRGMARPDGFKFAAGFGAGLVLAVLPWTARNYVRLGGWCFVRDNFGLELSIANNSRAEASLWRNAASHKASHPNLNRREAELVRELGELKYMKLRGEQARNWIRDNPGRFLRLTGERAWRFWFPDPAGTTPHAYTVWLITALSLPGLAGMWRRRRRAAVFLAAAAAAPCLLYCLVQSDIFYRYPVLWLSMLAGGCWLAEAAQRAWAHAPFPSLIELYHRGRG